MPTKCTKMGLSITLTKRLATPAGTKGHAKDHISFCSFQSKAKGLCPFNSPHQTGVKTISEAKEAPMLAHKMEFGPRCKTAKKNTFNATFITMENARTPAKYHARRSKRNLVKAIIFKTSKNKMAAAN